MTSPAIRMTFMVLGLLAGIFVAGYGLLFALDKIVLHGLAPSCSDGSPDWTARYCAVSWTPGLPFVAVFVAGVMLMAVSVPHPAHLRVLMTATGAMCASLSVLILWNTTISPVPPAPSQPPTPQVILLGVGLTLVVAARVWKLRERSRRRLALELT